MLEQGLSGYGGVTVSLPGYEPGHGLAVRGSVFSSQYSYMSGATRIRGTDTGGQLAGLYQFSGDWGWVDLGAGVRYVDVNSSPRDPGNWRRGSHADAGLVADGGWLANPWRADGYAEFGVDQHSYFTRASLSHAVDAAGQWHLGVEAGFQGDRYYDRSNIGALAIADFSGGLELRLSAGVSLQAQRADRGYITVGLSQAF